MKLNQCNVQSLRPNGSGNALFQIANHKLDEIVSRFVVDDKHDIICLTETWLNDTIQSQDISIDNYVCYRKDRPDGYGGICMYVSETLPSKPRPDLSHNQIELLWVEIATRPGSTMVGVCYRPPNQDAASRDFFLSELQQSLQNIMSINTNSIYLLGDFNDRCKYWDRPHSNSELGQSLYEMASIFNLHQLITEPTHYTSDNNNKSNILDLIFTDSPGGVVSSGVEPPVAASHHSVTYCVTGVIPKPLPYLRDIWSFDKGDYPSLNLALSEIPFIDILSNIESIDTCVSTWTELVLQAAREFIPNKTIKIKPQDKPWMTSHIKTLLKLRNRSFSRYNKSKKDRHKTVYNNIANRLTAEIRQAKHSYRKSIIDQITESVPNPKNFWKLHKQICNNSIKSSIPTLIDENQVYSQPKEKAELLGQYFASLSQAPVAQDTDDQPRVMYDTNPTSLDRIHISLDDVVNALKRLPVNKSAGPDVINNKILKTCSGVLAPTLQYLFNKSLSLGIYPSSWKHANITPIYKKNSKDNKENYRPVALLSSVGKAMEHIIFDKMYKYFVEHNILIPQNSGFKKGDSTVYQLIYLVNKIHSEWDQGNDVCIVYLDQSRAFDRIWHHGLLHKLSVSGIRSNLLQWVSDYLSNRQVRVVIDGCSSDWCKVSAGVPQGSILGPLFFLIYINDIVDGITCDISLYADDIALIVPFNNENMGEQFHHINNNLETLCTWTTRWHMIFNAQKTKYVLFSRRNINAPNIFINDQTIERLHSHSHLGLIMSHNLSWTEHINSSIEKAQRKLALIWKLNTQFPRFVCEKLYLSCIRPQLEYASIIYDGCSNLLKQKLDKFQRTAAIACTRGYIETSNFNLYRELGWESLQARQK